VIRRSFRIGLLLGMAAGLAAALAKLLQGRSTPAPSTPTRPWSPFDDRPGAAVPTGPGTASAPSPRVAPDPVVAPAPAATGVVERAEAGPVVEPLDDEAAEPAAPPAAPAEPVEPVEKVVPPKVAAPPRKAPAGKSATRATAKKSAKKSSKKASKSTKQARKQAASAEAWVEPDGSVCPTSHPVKAKLSSRLFHLPGMFAYDRTRPDRCYRDAVAAEADGLRAAKR
jgi:hypothetical protein